MKTLRKSRVTVLATCQSWLCGQLVMLMLVHVLSPDLDVCGVYAWSRRFCRVKNECDSTNLGQRCQGFFCGYIDYIVYVIIIAFIISMSIKLTKRYCFYINWGKIILKNSRNLVGFQFKLISNIKLTRMSYLVISEICHTPGILVCFFQFLKISFSSLTWGNLLSSFGHWETPFSRAWWICSPLTSIRTRESITGKIESKSWQMANQTKLKCLETFLVTINNALHKMEYRGWDRIEH